VSETISTPERTYSEHVEAARAIAAETYREDLSRISPAAQAALSRDLAKICQAYSWSNADRDLKA